MRDLLERTALSRYGIHFPDTAVYAQDSWRDDIRLAQDAQPQAVLQTNAGIPGFLTNIIDPEVVTIVTAPSRFAAVFGEVKKGDWTTLSAQFPTVEMAGAVSSYGDFDNNGVVDASGNWVPRQSFAYQTHKRYGERTVAMWGAAGVNYNAQLDAAWAYVFQRFQNRSYAFGIAGMQNYGALNDPSLIAASTPATKAQGGVSWALASADEQFRDVLALYTQLLAQMSNNIDRNSPMVLVLSPGREALLSKLSSFNVSARDMIAKNFPNLKIETIPEYSTTGGELMQLWLPSYQGQDTAYGAFTEKARSHAVVVHTSWSDQKMSAGTWGTIIRRPLAVAQMLGI